MSRAGHTSPQLLQPYPAAWATLALQLTHKVPAVVGDAAAGRILAALSAAQPPRATDVHLVLLGQVAPRLLQLAAERTLLCWRQQLGRDIDAFVVHKRSGQAALWHQRRGEATPPDAFAGLPWLAGELTGSAAQLAATMSACLVPIALLVGTGHLRQATVLALAMAATTVAGLFITEGLGQHSRTQRAQARAAHEAYGKIRHAFWDNVVLGNAVNRDRWQGAYQHASTTLQRQQNLISATSFLPTALGQLAGVAFWLAAADLPPAQALFSDAAAEKRTWLQQLPQARRAASSLGAASSLFVTVQALGRQRRDFQSRSQAVGESASLQPAQLIGPNAQVREGTAVAPATGLLANTYEGPGRSSIEGPNGSGKWMALLALKEKLGARAVLLPAHHDLMFGTGPGSSGQKARAALQQLVHDLRASPQVTHVLLERWDGNLDADNEQRLHGVVDELAQQWRVVEVRRAARQAFLAAPARDGETLP